MQCTGLYCVLQDYLIALAAGDEDNNSSDNPNAPPTLSDIDSPFQVQEYLSTLVAQDPHNIQRLVEVPRWRRRDGSSNGSESSADASVDRPELDDDDEEQTHVAKDIWLYEHLRWVFRVHCSFSLAHNRLICERDVQAPSERPLASIRAHAAGALLQRDVSRDEGRRMALPLRCARDSE